MLTPNFELPKNAVFFILDELWTEVWNAQKYAILRGEKSQKDESESAFQAIFYVFKKLWNRKKEPQKGSFLV